MPPASISATTAASSGATGAEGPGVVVGCPAGGGGPLVAGTVTATVTLGDDRLVGGDSAAVVPVVPVVAVVAVGAATEAVVTVVATAEEAAPALVAAALPSSAALGAAAGPASSALLGGRDAGATRATA